MGLHVLVVVGLWLTPGSVLREVAQSTRQRLFIPIVTEAPPMRTTAQALPRPPASLPRILNPKAFHLPAAQPVVKPAALPSPPKVELPEIRVAEAPALPRPVEVEVPQAPVRTGVFSVAPQAEIKTQPALSVRAGGFGEQLGPPGHPLGQKTVAATGAFDPSAMPSRGRTRGSATGGFVNTGFGQGESGPTGDPLARRQEVQAAGFGAPAPQAPAPKKVAVEVPVLTPVEILAKPKPLYTAEARSLKIEGQVTLEVVFGAAGQVRVVRVVRGLGHGLDETAAAAAEQIRFKPATENGQPADFRAMVHILFQLAY